ncbi:SIMPL domain-containing protein [Halomonas sp. NO4]|uniref:SIMPL domain-containing protein n=1 Tax=Halomonas sp. NO4 TaxID=2484813 RepID=UPI0013D5BE75|nr:SIMPL domain-containing protein [Halomonas sp. NO4]
MLRQTRTCPMLLTVLLALAAPLAALAEPPERRLDVQAEARLEVVPNRATLSARLWEHTPAVARHEAESDPAALREARNRLEQRAAELIQALEAAGVEPDAIRAGSLAVQPEYVPEPRRGDGEGEPQLRTRLERPVEVEVGALDRLPALLDALTAAGVDALDGVTYDLADRDAATDEALVMALEKARRKAQLMADTLGVSLGEVISVSENRSPVFQPRMAAMSADARESASAVEYRPGTLDIEAGVSVSWGIE